MKPILPLLGALLLALPACTEAVSEAPAPVSNVPAYSFSWYDTHSAAATPAERRLAVRAASQVQAEIAQRLDGRDQTPQDIAAVVEAVAASHEGTVKARFARIYGAGLLLKYHLVPDGVTAAERPLVAAQLRVLQSEGAASPALVAPALKAMEGHWSRTQIRDAAAFALRAPEGAARPATAAMDLEALRTL